MLSLGAVINLTLGVICAVWPGKVQRFALNCSRGRRGRLRPWLRWRKKRNDVLSIRASGVLAILVGLALAFVFIRRLFGG